MSTYIPPGWPAGVHPPGSEEFESTAVGWLLDVVPPDYRLHGVLRRYPIALAVMARHHSKACVEGAREGYRTARTELAGALPPHAIDTILAAYRKEGARLADTARAVDLVERALRGEVFTPKMRLPPTDTGPEDTGPESTGPESTGSEDTGSEGAEPKAAGRKAAEKKASGAKREQKTADGEVAGAKREQKTAGAERGRAGARRNSAGRARYDLART
jgi:hypothetical protein